MAQFRLQGFVRRIAIGIVVGFFGALLVATGLSSIGVSDPAQLGAAHLATWGLIAWLIGRRPRLLDSAEATRTSSILQTPIRDSDSHDDEVHATVLTEQTRSHEGQPRATRAVSWLAILFSLGVGTVGGFAIGTRTAAIAPTTTASTTTSLASAVWPTDEVSETCAAFDEPGIVSVCFRVADSYQQDGCPVAAFREVIRLATSQDEGASDEEVRAIAAQFDCEPG